MTPLYDQLKEAEEYYYEVREIPERGICGLQRMLYTVGLFYDIKEPTVGGRYCYKNRADAVQAIREWNGIGDPPGPWIKHKGRAGEYSNPNNNDHD